MKRKGRLKPIPLYGVSEPVQREDRGSHLVAHPRGAQGTGTCLTRVFDEPTKKAVYAQQTAAAKEKGREQLPALCHRP